MRAMLLEKTHTPLLMRDISKPVVAEGQLLIKVKACAVCRTDLHIKDGELSSPKFPLVLGHQIVGEVEEIGAKVKGFTKGQRVGVPWLAESCGQCEFCKEGEENLCQKAQYTGFHKDGGFAEYTVCRADFAIALPPGLSDVEIAPLLCGGVIGYRAYRKAAPKNSLGLYGFGSAAHILTQLAIYEKKSVYAFTRDGDAQTQAFAKKVGAVWAGGSSARPPISLDAAIIFAPVGSLVPQCLKVIKNGGRCICGDIHMSDIPSFPYRDLWGEKTIQSVTNLTRQDAVDFFALLEHISFKTHVSEYPLEKADQALEDLREGKFQGSAVIVL